MSWSEGFANNSSTSDYLQILNELIFRSNEYENMLYMTFVDLEKTFDLVSTKVVTKDLEE